MYQVLLIACRFVACAGHVLSCCFAPFVSVSSVSCFVSDDGDDDISILLVVDLKATSVLKCVFLFLRIHKLLNVKSDFLYISKENLGRIKTANTIHTGCSINSDAK